MIGPRLGSPEQVRRELRKVYSAMKNGELEKGKGGVAVYLLSGLLKSMKNEASTTKPEWKAEFGGREPIPSKLRFRVLRRDGFTCRYCGRSAPEVALHVDHVKPVVEGGTTVESNLVAACRECNLGKSDTPAADRPET